MWRILVVALALFVSLSGCLSGDPAPTTEEPGAPAHPAPIYNTTSYFEVGNDLSNCDEVGLFVPTDKARLQAMLPPGFVPLDGSRVTGMSAPAGQAVVALTVARCRTSELEPGVEGLVSRYSEASVAVLVEPPPVTVDSTATLDFYEFGRATDGAGHVRLLSAVGWLRAGSLVELDVGRTEAVGLGQVTDDAGPVYRIDVAGGPLGTPMTGTFRFWHATPGGLAYFDYTFTSAPHGGPTTCWIRSGSLAAAVSGITSCSASNASGFVHWAFNSEGSFRYLAGVNATA